jgi:hypothetical protein
LNHSKNEIKYIIRGWNKHLEVDRYFHSSPFFLTHSHQLKKLLTPALKDSPVKPFFLGHIALELILDSLLVTTEEITVDSFYNHLDKCETTTIGEFLTFSGLSDTTGFFNFFSDFKKSRYLHSYAETKEIAYALKRICMRVWKNPFTPENESIMTDILFDYRRTLLEEFTLIFDEIGTRLA